MIRKRFAPRMQCSITCSVSIVGEFGLTNLELLNLILLHYNDNSPWLLQYHFESRDYRGNILMNRRKSSKLRSGLHGVAQWYVKQTL